MANSNSTLSILLRAVGATQAANDVKKVDSAIGKLTTRAGQGLHAAASNIAKIGAVATGVLATQVYAGIKSLESLESATTSVDAAIRQMGQTGAITASQVATWSNEIEASIGAAFDDKDITRATATLIRFGKVTPTNLHEAMQVMTDLAAKTGDVDSASTLLAKALADPAKAAGKLSRAGVVLTKVQQDQIKAFVKAGKVADAQKLILDALAKTTAGAAAATQGPYKRAMSVLADVTEDAQRALAEGFLPVIERVATVLSKKLADPKVISEIRTFGQGLAGMFDKALDAAERIPWGSIGDAFRLAGQGAKAAFDLFTGLPPWIQTAVLTGWGLNKLTGGALGGIVGELGKGLIKGVLGMNAAVVNINAGVVNGGGGGPGLPPTATGGAPSVLATAAKLIPVIAVGAVVGEVMKELDHQLGVTPGNLRDPNDPRQSHGTTAPTTVALAPGAKVSLSATDRSMFRSQDEAQRGGIRRQLAAADTTAERIGTLHSQLAGANATLEQIERNRIAVTLKNVATTIVRISANEVNRAQTTFKVYNSGSAGKFAL